MPGDQRLALLHRDLGFGNDPVMREAGYRGLPWNLQAIYKIRNGQLPQSFWIQFAQHLSPAAVVHHHMEAITGQPVLQHAISNNVRDTRQTTIITARSHAEAFPAAQALRAAASFLHCLTKNAEPLTASRG